MTETPRILIFLLSPKWTGISRLSQALIRSGFQVATLSVAGSYLSKTRYAHRHVVMSPEANVLEFLLGVIRDAQPHLIIPGCEAAVRFLHQFEQGDFEQECAELSSDTHIANALALVRYSLGSSEFYTATSRKNLLVRKAQQLGVCVPDQSPVGSLQDALSFVQRYGYPVVLKKEYSSGGHGVRICNNAQEMESGLRSLFSMKDQSAVKTKMETPEIVVQQFIRGTTAMQVFSAMSGHVLERMTALKERCYPTQTGPSSVVHFIEHREMDNAVNTLLAGLQFSGLGGVDFIIEERTQQAYLLELNPRPCPISHLGYLVGRDITRALYCHLTHNDYERVTPLNLLERIALFPQEWLRDPQSLLLTQLYHDVPWDDPVLLRALIN